ncbi:MULTISPECIES: glycosyltransferase family 4 protein [unclassified Spirosoma]|uniref:glycosyltransferase family 4 protein n=1 Tax=unclassified Spirosoma TaxID=2621999 RepID=UPI000960BA0B|nr:MULTISPECIES: glycosyltransferase family 4 protein [unclassified Spirosoma]MBN8821367.1 glycosyltransferase family 4 protein [Spirosoma sp.]OJW78154.1 MAG: glycosyl transferase family 1 [Spirosoma sp. 48-14]
MNLLLIGHDANRAGAQLVLLNVMRLLKVEGFQMHLLLGEGGPLLEEYQAICPVTIWPTPPTYAVSALADKVLWKLGQWQQFYERRTKAHQQAIRAQLGLDKVDLVLVNTVTSSRWVAQLAIPDQIPVVTFVHELDMSVRIYTRPDELAYLLKRTNHMLAVSKATARYYEQEHGFDPTRISLYTLIDTPSLEKNVQKATEQPSLYASLGLPADALIVGGCGNAEWRKGNDLFVSIARQVIGRYTGKQPIHFVWVGMPKGTLHDDIWLDIRKAGLADRVHLIPPTPEVLRYTSRFDVFVLCSREDPYPLVVFEAGLSGVPVVCFDGAGGSPELVETDGGYIVPYLDLDAMSDRIIELLQNPDLRRQMGQRLGQKILERHPAKQSVDTLIKLFNQLAA